MHAFNQRRWAFGWLRGVARGVADGHVAPETLPTAAVRALTLGLTADEITRIVREIDEAPEAACNADPERP